MVTISILNIWTFILANNLEPDQTAPEGTVRSGPILFAIPLQYRNITI